MTFTATIHKARRRLLEQRDLLALLAVLVVAQPLVPLGHPLADDALVPWTALAVGGAALIRGRAPGPGAHPSLTPHRDRLGAVCRQLSLGLSPVVVLGLFEAARTGAVTLGASAAGLGFLAGVLRVLGQRDGQTAWRPQGSALWPRWVGVVVGLIGGSLFLGALEALVDLDLAPVTRALALGLAFLSVGLIAGDPVHALQRAAAGRRDGKEVRRDPAPHLLAGLGPTISWLCVGGLYQLIGDLDFGQAHIVALHAVAWAGALWLKPLPAAMTVLLHEVVPAGGVDRSATAAARAFDEPPDGSLRVSPLRVRRTRLVRPWIVPIKDARVSGLDDPARPLWSQNVPSAITHVLGDARFEVDPDAREPQRHTITVHVHLDAPASGLANLGKDHQQFARVVVLRPHSSAPGRDHGRHTLYAWDPRLPADAVQILDGQTRELQLRNGDVVVVSSEGVAYAYELEIGSPLSGLPWHSHGRMPQIEDYVKAG